MIREVSAAQPAAPPHRPAAPAAAPPARAEPPAVSPALRVEPALNLVVIEFRDPKGAVQHSIPSARELEAYRSGAAEPPPALDITG